MTSSFLFLFVCSFAISCCLIHFRFVFAFSRKLTNVTSFLKSSFYFKSCHFVEFVLSWFVCEDLHCVFL